MLPNPIVQINGVDLAHGTTPGALAPVAALADLTITWGQESLVEPPRPASLSATLRYRGSVDVLRVALGDAIDVRQEHPDQSRTAFSGRIRSMSSELDDEGRLRLHISATDHLADLDNTYVSTAWHSDDVTQAGGTTVRQHLHTALNAAGWATTGWENLPAERGPSSATFYNSIKLTTLLRRYLAQHGPQATYWDSSYHSSVGGHLVRRVSIGYMATTAPGDHLGVTSSGTWALDYGQPAPLVEVEIPASNVLRDVSWEASPENLITAAQVSHQVTRREDYDDGTSAYVTGLDEHHVNRGASWLAQYGTRAVELETMTRRGTGLDSRALWSAIGRRWMDDNGDEWRPSGLTVWDSSKLAPQLLSDMVGKETRQRQWIVVPGVQVHTPRGDKADLRGAAIGGTLTWDHRYGRWAITVNLADTQRTTAVPWTFADLAGMPDARFSEAAAPKAGSVGFSSFETISTIGATA